MQSAEYWAQRAEASEALLDRKATQTIKSVTAAYETAMDDIRADMLSILGKVAKNGKLTKKEARALLNLNESHQILDELRERISTIKDKQLKQELLLRINAPSYRARLTRLQALQDSIEIEFSRLADTQLRAMHTRLIDTMTESYHRTIYNLQTGVGVGFSFNLIPSRAIENALTHKWDGKNYSERVWDNTQFVADQAKEIITAGLASGKTVRRMARELEDATGGSKLAATRLIRSENNYFHNQGALEGYKESGLERYRYLATLDAKTCTVCGVLDRKTFLLSEAVVGENYPPIHWNDRCTVCPVIDGKDYSNLKRRARDPVTGKSYTVPADMTWEEWKKTYVTGLAKSADDGKMKDTNLTPIAITDEAINAIAQVGSPSLTDGQNAILHEKNRNLLQYMQNDSPGREGIVYYSSDLDRELYRAKGERGQVTSKNDIGNDVICIHNHPTGNTFTHTDVIQLLRDQNLKTLIAVGNDGNVFLLEKSKGFDRSTVIQALQQIIPKLDPKMTTPELYLQTMEQFLSGSKAYGLIYRKGAPQ